MGTIFYIITGSVLLCATIILGFIIANKKKRNTLGKKGGIFLKRALKNQQKNATKKLQEADRYKDPNIKIQDFRYLELPSPTRPPNSTDSVIIDLLRNTSEIPSAILEIAATINDKEVHIKKLSELIATDPVLSTRILRIANSAAVARGKVTSINLAIMLLGLNQVSILVNQMLASNAIKSAFTIDTEEMLELWQHSAAVACCTRHITMSLKNASPSLLTTVQTCALLHDIGKFYLKGLKSGSDAPCEEPCILAEMNTYGTDHAHIGYMLADYWNLPELITYTIGYHHHLCFANYKDTPKNVRQSVALVTTGDYMAHILGYNATKILYKIPDPVLMMAGVEKDLDHFFTKTLMKEIKYTNQLITEAEKSP